MDGQMKGWYSRGGGRGSGRLFLCRAGIVGGKGNWCRLVYMCVGEREKTLTRAFLDCVGFRQF